MANQEMTPNTAKQGASKETYEAPRLTRHDGLVDLESPYVESNADAPDTIDPIEPITWPKDR